ncbi:hypothetical protein DAEQUDRAFT_384018 [Daedalea quercina L-15889]|uniref:BTB domain-containing protein n=1 Tax=Daedalea quercina L-15889 TaxID=1314783 RepID=A0A165P113_9APHY|nr:hypothetical protein DAEQUDRAFT_384018 [Daedalea quercina L-15889]
MDHPAQVNECDHAFVRDDEIWFSDGNIVLEAQGHAFKVYQGLLAHISEVFRDLFTVAQPSGMETFDGCPLISLTDHPDEFRHLLRAVFPGRRITADERLEFTIVAAVVRLSHKYQINYVREAYLSRLKSCFCTDFDTWNSVSDDHGSKVMSFRDTDAIAAVNIARLTGTDTMLPSALFQCCELDPERLLKGVARADGTCETLSLQDTAKSILGRQTLIMGAISTAFSTLDPDKLPPECSQNHVCRHTIGCLRAEFMNREPSSIKSFLWRPKVLISGSPEVWASVFRSLQRRCYLCQSCLDVLCNAQQAKNRKRWARLPRLLDLEMPVDWPEE